MEEENLVANADRLGKITMERLNELYNKFEIIGDVRGLGLMTATEFVLDRKTKEPAKAQVDKIVVESYKKGLLLLPCGKSSLRYIPPVNIPEDQLLKGFDILEGAIKTVVN
jgi:4-aminobutyrate aminotransferase